MSHETLSTLAVVLGCSASPPLTHTPPDILKQLSSPPLLCSECRYCQATDSHPAEPGRSGSCQRAAGVSDGAGEAGVGDEGMSAAAQSSALLLTKIASRAGLVPAGMRVHVFVPEKIVHRAVLLLHTQVSSLVWQPQNKRLL